MDIKEFILKLIELIRPKFYNKLTWAIVIAGLTLMSKNIFAEIIIAVFENELKYEIINTDTNFWGFILIITGLLYNLITNIVPQYINFKKNDEKNNEIILHDRKIFEKSKEILTEIQFTDFLECILTDHSYMSKDSNNLINFVYYFQLPENKFINMSLNQTTEDLLKSIGDLLNFINYNFFIYPNNYTGNNPRLCMHPEWNIDRAADSFENFGNYNKASDELNRVSMKLKDTYSKFRHNIKLILTI